ncbi:NFACT family protein [Candidatus Bathyarchaeota archaeon]|nr:NFACT family protein [Candidatus Bathyarchaeota archaeon]
MHKEEFSSFDVAATIRELREAILNARVSNIYQIDEKTLIFKLRKGEDIYNLILEAGKRLNLTSYALEKPLVPPAFCMALRKFLRNSLLTNIEQYEFERVVLFDFSGKLGNFRLVLELFGEGNIILVDGENRILQALCYRRMRDRNIIRGEAFRFAPASGQNPTKISTLALFDGLKSFGEIEVVRVLARFLSIGGVYAEEILTRLGIEKTTKCESLLPSQVEAIHNCLREMLSQVFKGELEPCIILSEDGTFVDVTPLRLKRYEGLRHQPFNSFNEALDEFYAKTEALKKAAAEKKAAEQLMQEAERLKRVLAEQEKALKDAEQKAEKYRRIGDTICAYSSELQTLLDKFLTEKKAGRGWDEIVSEVFSKKREGLKPHVFFESFDKQRLILNLCIDDLHFGIDIRKALFWNAAKFYERAKLSRRKLEGARVALEETRKRLSEIEAKIQEVKVLEEVVPVKAMEEIAKRKVKPRKWFEKFKWFTSSDGFLVLAGKDATSNEVLIKKYTALEDIVFHADVAGAPFVVIKTEGRKPTEKCLQEAAEFAAAHSRGWREGFASVDVYWVKPDQLSKAGGSGEYVPRGSFTISGTRNWMRNTPLKIAIGVQSDEADEAYFIGGPVDAVKAKTKIYTVIAPGENSGKQLLKQVLKVLAEKAPKEKREKILKASIEQIRELIPYCKGRIIVEG